MQTEPLLTQEQEAELLADRENPAAVEELVKHNQGLILYVAKHYNYDCGDQELEDLIQWGNIGLIKAISKWDSERGKGNKFSTLAVWWIRAEINRHMTAGSDFTVPNGVRQNAARVYRARAWLEQKLGHEPTREEIADQSGMSLDFVEQWLDRAKTLKLDKAAHDIFGEDNSLFELIDSGEEGPEEVIERRDTIRSIWKAIRELPERDQEIMTRYYLGEQTFREIGEALGISHQFVTDRAKFARQRIRAAMSLL